MMDSFRQAIGTEREANYVRALHDKGGVVRDDSGVWIIAGESFARAVLRDHGGFSSSVVEDGYPLLMDDPPKHTLLRKRLQGAFLPASVRALGNAVEEVAARLAARIRSGAEVDAVETVAVPLPVSVIGILMGIDEAAFPDFRRMAERLAAEEDATSREADSLAKRGLRECFRRHIDEPRAGGALIDTLARAVAAAPSSQREEARSEAVDLAMVLLTAGIETTGNLITNVLHSLATRPVLWKRIGADSALRSRVIEESLRLDSPVRFVPRVAVADRTIGNAEIRRGDRLIVFLGAANRDSERWINPDRFDCARSRNRHLAFGHGIHFCLGAHLARVEAEAALTALRRRFSTLRPGSAAPILRGPGVLHGFRKLPLIFGDDQIQ